MTTLRKAVQCAVDAPPPKRRRSKYTGAQLLEDAEALMARTGYRGFSLGELAQQLGVTRTNVHHHFRTKEALGAALLRDYCPWWRDRLGDPLDGTPKTALEQLVRLYEEARDRSGPKGLPLATMLGTEIHTLPPAMAQQLKGHEARTLKWLQAALGGTPKARHQAQFVISLLEGGLMLAHVAGAARWQAAAWTVRHMEKA